jgi:hypothetical protein
MRLNLWRIEGSPLPQPWCDELQELRRLEQRRALVDEGTPLSRAEVCRILRVDIKTTLAPLIAAKKICTVPWTRGEVRIPVAELRRLQREGLPAVEEKKPTRLPPAPRAQTSTQDAKAAAEEIRRIKIR